MKLKQITFSPYDFMYSHGYRRMGALIKLETEDGHCGEGDLAPLQERSKESLLQSTIQLKKCQTLLTSIEWNSETFLEQLAELHLYPSLSFALESALFSIFTSGESYYLDVAALLMGNSAQQILDIAIIRKNEGYTTAKLKIGNLNSEDAYTVINELKGIFKLLVDVNSRWPLSESIRFFSQFPIETFDYIEDPISSIKELHYFPYPIAIEEPISKGISLSMIEAIPALKAVTYKPTVQGGHLAGLKLKQWADERGIMLVLSSSLESDIGHYHLVAAAGRLGLTSPIGIGTYHYLNPCQFEPRLHFSKGKVYI